MKEYPEVYAVDFDGTLSLGERYPTIGRPNKPLIAFLRERQQEGDRIILWTCREGEYLTAAVQFCRENGLIFDAVNDNMRENQKAFGNNCRKVFAHYYIDDRNLMKEEWQNV